MKKNSQLQGSCLTIADSEFHSYTISSVTYIATTAAYASRKVILPWTPRANSSLHSSAVFQK